MIFFVSRNGTIIDTLHERVYQNSSKATTIYFVGDFASTNSLTVAFTLPDGTYTNDRIMTEVDELDGFENFSVWAYTLPNNITAYAGSVGCQFKVHSLNTIVATAYSSFNVEVGVPSIEELDPEESVVEQILAILGTKLDKKTHGGNITYIYGVTGTTQKQIPVDTTPTGSFENLIVSGAVWEVKNDLQCQITLINGTLQDKAEYTYVDDKYDELQEEIETVDGKITGFDTALQSKAEYTYVDNAINTEVARAENSYVKALYGYYDNDDYTAFVRGENGNGENITACTLEFAPLVNELKDYTNTQVAQNTANFRGTWDNYNAIPTNTELYPADYSGNRVPTNSDYLVVVNYTKDGQQGTWRFKYTGSWATQGKNGWQPEYLINSSTFTQEQLNAINSGITSSKVAQITTNQNNIETLSGGIQENAQAIQTLDNAKLDKVSTSGNLRAYTIDANGNQTITTIATTSALASNNALAIYTTTLGNDRPGGNLITGNPSKQYHCTTKKYVDESLNSKLDIVTLTGNTRIYAVNTSGQQTTMIPYATPAGNTLVIRDPQGCLQSNAPKSDNQCVNKKYFDDNVTALEYWE